MKLVIVTLCVIATALAEVIIDPEVSVRRSLPAVDFEDIRDELGQYTLRYVTAEGTIVSEKGRLVPNSDGTGHVLVTEGETTYIGDDGKTYITKYSAGLDGLKVEGEHLPKAPEPIDVPIADTVAVPIPEFILVSQ